MSLILDALRKSEHGRHGASDSVLPLIVTPRAGRARKKRVAYLPILIMLFVVMATAVVFLYREKIFPPRTVVRTSEAPAPVLAKPQLVQQSQKQIQQQMRAEAPIKEAQQASPPEVEPIQSVPSLKSEEPPLIRSEIAVSAPPVADRPKVVQRSQSPQLESASLPDAEQVTQLNSETEPEFIAETGPAVSRPKPKPDSRTANEEVTPAALSTFPENFISKVQPLHLDFHVYSSDKSRRMVYINNREYEEGDRLNSNLKIVRIVPQGAVMQWNRQSFLLTARD